MWANEGGWCDDEVLSRGVGVRLRYVGVPGEGGVKMMSKRLGGEGKCHPPRQPVS